MKNYLTNFGNELAAKNIDSAIQELSENYVALAAERVACPLKLHSCQSFTHPKMVGVGVRLIAVPDLPPFVANLISHLPEIDLSFLIGPPATGGELWEIENLHLGSTPFHYEGKSWEEVASLHSYFVAACNALKDGRKPQDLFLQNFFSSGEGHMTCQVYTREPHDRLECIGSCQATGKPL